MINSALIESLGSRENLILKLNGKEICTILKGQNSIWHTDVLSQETRSSKNRKTETGKKTRDFNAAGWRVLEVIMYRSNRSFNMPPPGIPRALDTFALPGRREFDYQSFPGVGNLIPCFRGGEFEPHPRFHVKSLAWRAMGDPVLEDFRGKH